MFGVALDKVQGLFSREFLTAVPPLRPSPVLTAESAHAVAFRGIAWGAALLREILSASVWTVLARIVGGLVVVGPWSEAAQPLPALADEPA